VVAELQEQQTAAAVAVVILVQEAAVLVVLDLLLSAIHPHFRWQLQQQVRQAFQLQVGT
jgi:hypothetical protein